MCGVLFTFHFLLSMLSSVFYSSSFSFSFSTTFSFIRHSCASKALVLSKFILTRCFHSYPIKQQLVVPFLKSSSLFNTKPALTICLLQSPSTRFFFFFSSSSLYSSSLVPFHVYASSFCTRHITTTRTTTMDEAKLALNQLALFPPHLETAYTNYSQRAGVLVPLMTCPTLGLCTLLTVRSQHLRSHGKFEPSDTSLRETAYREAQEEIAIPTSILTFITSLPPLRSIAGIWVHPYLVHVPLPSITAETWVTQLVPNKEEVADIFVSPLAAFLDANKHRSHELHGRQIHVFEVHWKEKVYEVWGLTAILCIQLASLAFNKPPEFDFRYTLNSSNMSNQGKL